MNGHATNGDTVREPAVWHVVLHDKNRHNSKELVEMLSPGTERPGRVEVWQVSLCSCVSAGQRRVNCVTHEDDRRQARCVESCRAQKPRGHGTQQSRAYGHRREERRQC